ncbi:hypothetical protein Q7P37_002550 [Cladosporium fusiforme]
MAAVRRVARKKMEPDKKQDDDPEWEELLQKRSRELEILRQSIIPTLAIRPGSPKPSLAYTPSQPICLKIDIINDSARVSLEEPKTSTAIPTTPSTGQTTPFRLFDLPQKVQDAIFKHAYGKENEFNIVAKHQWNHEQAGVRRLGGTTRPFPPHKVNEWLVSNCYLQLAGQAWMSAQPFLRLIPARMPLSQLLLIAQSGLFLNHAVTATLVFWSGYWGWEGTVLARCRSLQRLVLVIEKGEERMYQHALSDDEHERFLEKILPSLPGVKQIYVTDGGFRQSGRAASTFAHNIRSLERVARTRLLFEPGSAGNLPDPGQSGKIYSGSKVSYP